MGEYADVALDQSIDEWLDAMENPEDDDEYWVGYSRRPLCKERATQSKGPGPCPKCGADTILRKGKFGEFYGCSTFPNCKGTRKV